MPMVHQRAKRTFKSCRFHRAGRNHIAGRERPIFKGEQVAKERKIEADRLIEREVILMKPDFKERYHAYVDAITPEPTDGSKRKVNVSTHIREGLEAELALHDAGRA